mmetsp:Transcript_21815/g.40865  ORF Transcript_21815/g.40865 Transcript_21815/m.40865 type:complete len:309 (-) Transcript_21815:3986-4912(-)
MASKKGGNSHKTVEIDDLLHRLHAIEKEMPQDEKGKGKAKGATGRTDRFLEIKSDFLEGMSSVKDSLREVKESKGITRTRDQIARTQHVRAKLKELSKQFAEMEVLYTKEMKKRKSKVGAEELAIRAQFLQQFKRDLEMLKKLSSKSFSMGSGDPDALEDVDLESGATSGAGFNFADLMQTSPQPGTGTGAGSAHPKEVELSSVQQQSLDQIKARDKQFDDILDQIGVAVDQAAEKAKLMHDEVELQNNMLDKVEENLDRNFDKLNNLNVRIKKDLEDKGMGMERFCINCICLVVLLGIVGAIVQVAT